jgi:Ca2+-transporting ATPase
MTQNPFTVPGLTTEEIRASRRLHGSNALQENTSSGWKKALLSTVTEPMFLLLVFAAILYFLLGELPEAVFMMAAIVLVSAISFYQDSRSRHALEALRSYTMPLATVVRDGAVIQVPSTEIVVGDFAVAAEGTNIVADGEIVQANDFTVNESILTGEAFPVMKNAAGTDRIVYQGTTVVSGLALIKILAVGSQTRLGKIGTSIEEITEEPTPLQQQINRFVKIMAIVGGVVFVIIWITNFINSGLWMDSLLKALTLAMSILPEEIPVAFSTFMALGAWRLMKEGIIVKQTRTVETLGSATVICTDKTGTITENRMEMAWSYIHEGHQVITNGVWDTAAAQHLLRIAMWASEPVPFDPMEKVLHESYGKLPGDERASFQLIHEYPLGGKPPRMTHIFADASGKQIVACKGAPEGIIRNSGLSADEQTLVLGKVQEAATRGLRVLAVAESAWATPDFPKDQHELPLKFLGLVGFYDPPKANIREVFDHFDAAGIQLKIITGDNAFTTEAIARQAGFRHADQCSDGTALMSLGDEAFAKQCERTFLFTRMYPEAKLRVIQSLKKQQHIVAMTGDGVNDGPALKAAHIGIAMGKRGTEIAKQAASLILTDDNLSKMITAIAMGRKIYANLKKAIQYIISIHIPIVLTVSIPLLLGWVFPNIFSPVHVIFLELIMGPTCSIIYENEPLEKNSMRQPPRHLTQTFLNWRELSLSLVQGLAITVGTLGCYQWAIQQGCSESLTRALVFTTLVSANIMLTLVNRSFYYSMMACFRARNPLLVWMIIATLGLLLAVLYVPLFARFFTMSSPAPIPALMAAAIGITSVVWFEIYKGVKRLRHPIA